MRTSKKENGSLTIDKADWKKAKELHSQIASIRKNMEKSSIKGLHQNARTAVKQKDYDGKHIRYKRTKAERRKTAA